MRHLEVFNSVHTGHAHWSLDAIFCLVRTAERTKMTGDVNEDD